MKLLTLQITKALVRRWLPFAWVGATFALAAVLMIAWWPGANVRLGGIVNYPPELRKSYGHIAKRVHDFSAKQQASGTPVVSDRELGQQLSRIQLDAASGNFKAAKASIGSLSKALDNWEYELDGGAAARLIGDGSNDRPLELPILLYHYPPSDFEAQLVHLEQRGYTVIDLDQASAGLSGAPLPAKPVVITFDDGFAAQRSAVDALIRHRMKATFYIIDGGPSSAWCIGAGRRYGDPLQPPGGCGDSYYNWDQVRELDRTGLITIGAHTINHRNLAMLSPAEQEYEIKEGKRVLEREICHPVRHFAYPYGAYDATSVQLVRAAGYLTAVTVMPGTFQPAGSRFELRRVRTTFDLP